MKTNTLIIILSVTLVLSGCSGFLREYSQDAVYPRTYTDLDELLIGEGYMTVRRTGPVSSGTKLYYPYVHFMADEAQECTGAYNGSRDVDPLKSSIFGYFTWQQRVGITEKGTSYTTESGDWERIYAHINIANNVIASAPGMPKNTARDRNGVIKVTAEAHFLRAAYYFILVNLYGKPYDPQTAATDPGVPLKTTEYIEDVTFRRESVEKIYGQITDDLAEAEKLFMQIDAPATIYRAGLTAANLLQSRVYLYMQRWQDARDYAEKALAGQNALTDLNGFSGGFLSKASAETIFSMGGNCLPYNTMYCFNAFRVSDDLYDAYDPDDDLRRDIFWYVVDDFIGYTKIVGEKTLEQHLADDGDANDYYFECYSNYYSYAQVEVSDNFLLRTAEAYLNHAEACAYLGDETAARKSLNTLRGKRYASGSDYEIASSSEQLVRDIRLERRLELAFEGHRWFDLRRYMVCEHYPESKRIKHDYYIYEGYYMTNIVERRSYILEPFDQAYTLNIPQDVIDYNTGMENNPRPARTYTTF